MIHRIYNRDRPFAQIDKRPLDNPLLSWKAKGLLAYFMSRPDDWIIRTEQLLTVSCDGEFSLRSAMKELRDAGHAELVHIRSEDGREAMGTEWHIHEIPMSEIAETSVSGNLSLRKPRPTNKDTVTNKEEDTNKELCCFKEIVSAWNSLPSPFPKVVRLTSGRKRHLQARLGDDFWSSNWNKALLMIPYSPFLSGNNNRGWMANFDWFITDRAVPQIIEGKYSPRESVNRSCL